ncbi:hypothetical protein [Chlorobium phaeobacteroides]|jgi:hypothetical protein|uniref:Uncharacterized protein n=1 Tax=Chlorobium phaeobacteroides (strain DSM 266 / SMG 266 / 2430) TaxID=290317 RepID=A1BJ61_CHLPD|nr:hypothetical protein [Chlorobium phaeobacteroides]ABL66438.1 conserved hypothetical protein [Chlorobium phaeobacteroides DSM 266]MBV5319535.1 hypothetical protein [Chlorobium phaeobacteroides]
MEQQNTGQKILDPIERAKLGIKVLNMPFSEAERVIDDYVSGGNYEKAGVDFFKDQVATQRHIQEKSAELVSTGGEILRLVVNAFARNLAKSPTGNNQAS